MVSLIDMLALWLMVGVPIVIWQIVAKNFGPWLGVGAGILSAVVCITSVVLYYRDKGKRCEQRRRELREKYQAIYRVVALPTDEGKIKKPQGNEIKMGDYGWEAEPLNQDGLVYLQGLTDKWRVVWYAGFLPDQIESVGPKPRSQYDWDYSWATNPPPCPFPVQERATTSMGLPSWLRQFSPRKQTSPLRRD